MSCNSIYKAVYVGQRVGVSRACLVQISVVDAHAPFAVLFLNQNDVGHPSGVLCFSYEFCLYEFFYFGFGRLSPFFS